MSDSMIVLGDESAVWIKVKVPVLLDGGRKHNITFDARLARKPQDYVNQIVKRISDVDDELNDVELCEEVLQGWRNVKGIAMSDGSEPSFNDTEQRAEFLNFNRVQSEIVKAWFELSTGGRIKN